LNGWWLDPRLARCRRIFLRGLAVPARIGIHDHERVGPQRLLLDVDLFVALEHSTPRGDALAEVVDYDVVRRAVLERIERGHVNLQETLIDAIAAELLADPAVTAVRIASAKPDVYPDVEAVGIEVIRFREQP
jgi:7,8-dihydroneopterin aldolase/epimerase/oxygenase